MKASKLPETETQSDPVVDSARADRDMLSTVKGGGILMAGRLATYASRFAITFVLARLLGAENYGLYNLAITAAMLAGSIAAFGLDTTLTRYIAIMNSRNDRAGLWGVIQIGISVSFTGGLLIATGLFALAYPIANTVFHEPRLAPLLQIASLVVPFLALSDVLAGATRGFKKMSDTVIAQNIVQPLLRLVLILGLALVGLDLKIAILIFGAADLCASILLLFFLNRRFDLRQSLSTARRDSRAVLGFTLPLWLSNIMTSFRANLQTLLVGSLDTVRGAGIFAIANQVDLIGNIFHASMNQAARPLIAELNDQGRHRQVEQIYQTTTRWVVSVNLPLVLVIMLFPLSIMSVFGKSFEAGAPALAIMGLVNLVNVATGMCGTILDMTGHTRLKLLNSVIRVSAAILANFLLIPRWGITGAALAALIHEVIANALPLVEVWLLYRILPYNRGILKPLAAGALAAGASLLLRLWLPVGEQILGVALHMLFVLAVYGALIQVFGLSYEERLVITRLRRKVTRFASRISGGPGRKAYGRKSMD